MSYFYRVLFDEVSKLRETKDDKGNLIENEDLKKIIENIDNLDITDKMLRLSIYKEEFNKLKEALAKGEEYIIKEKLNINENTKNDDYSSLFQ